MIAPQEPTLLDQWRERIGRRRRWNSQPRPLGALSYLTNGPVIEGLIEIDHLVFVALFDDPADRGGHALRVAGFSPACVPWGVRWGGPEQSKFFKNLLLQPMPGARGQRLDTASADLLGRALQFPWVSDHWQQATAVFADLARFSRRQVFPLHHLPDALVGCQGVAEYDFFHSCFRRQLVEPQAVTTEFVVAIA